MSEFELLLQRWRSFLGLSIAGGMLVWGRFLDPGLAPWLSSVYAAYSVLCVFVCLASVVLALQETMAAGRQARLEHARKVRQAHDEFSARCAAGSEG